MSSTTALRLRRLEAAVVPRLQAFAASPEMLAIRSSLPYSFAGLAAGLAIFMTLHSGGFLQRFAASFPPAFGVMSMTLVVLLCIDLARRREVPIPAALGGACCAFALSLPRFRSTPEKLLAALGSSGLFLAIGLGLFTVAALTLGRRALGPRAGTVAGALAPVVVAALLRAFGFSLTGALDALIAPLGELGDSLAALLIITGVETLLWTVGVHGPALLAAVVLPVYLRLQFANTAALAHGHALPHIVTVSTFLFIFPGGAGATLPLVLLLLLRARRKRDRRVAYATILPSVLNANEPLMFGLPVVLNPYLGVPFVLAPLALALVTWEAMNLGFVSRPAYYIPSTVPLPLSVFFATGNDWRAIVLIVVNLALAGAIYLPFVRLYLRAHREEEA